MLDFNGKLGYIVPHKFFNAKYGEPVREVISSGNHLSEIVHFGDEQVFTGATTYTALLFLDRAGNRDFRFVKADDLTAWRTTGDAEEGTVPAANATPEEWNFVIGRGAKLFERLKSMPVKLGDAADRIFQGLITGADSAFILLDQEDGSYFSEASGRKHVIEEDLMRPLCKGSVDIKRYKSERLTKSILFPYKLTKSRAELLSEFEFEQHYPQAWEYLQSVRGTLESRERGKWKHDRWFAFGRSQNLSAMEQKKIMTPSIAPSASFMLDETGVHYFIGSGGGGGGGYGITVKESASVSYEYLVALLNSKLLDMYLQMIAGRFRGGYFAYSRQYIEQLPIRTIDFSDAEDVERHERMVRLVERMLDLHGKLSEARIERERTVIGHRIAATDREIDRLVYELYGLSEEEIGVVEGSNPR